MGLLVIKGGTVLSMILIMIVFSYLTVVIIKHLEFWVAVAFVFTILYTAYKVAILHNIQINEIFELYYAVCKQIIKKCIDIFITLSQV